MGLILLFGMYLSAPQSWQESFKKFASTPTMENPQYSYYKPLEHSCRIVKDTSDDFFKNDKYECK